MEATFKEISHDQFVNVDLPWLFDDESTSRKFGLISVEQRGYKFSWDSNLIQPEIEKIETGVYSIGIDQHFAIVDFVRGMIPLNIHLFYNFYNTKLSGEHIFVCTELEVLVVRRGTYNVVRSFDLPEFFDELIIEASTVKIICVDQQVVEETL